MKQTKLTLFIALLICCSALAVNAQNAPDTLSAGAVKEQLIRQYHKGIGQQSGLYNGPLYEPNAIIVKGNPYFDSTDWITGTVVYDGVTYHNVSLKYDLYKDLLAALLFDGFSDYNLMTDRVSSFDLNNHHFVNIAENDDIKGGFYDELYHGRSSVLVKHKIIIQTVNSTQGTQKAYEYHRYYYVEIRNRYYEVSSKGDVEKLFKDRKREVQKYLKSNNINFKKDKEATIVAAVSYYDQLSNN